MSETPSPTATPAPTATPTVTPAAPSASAAPQGAAAATGDWTTGLSDEMRGYAQTKGFKDPSVVLDSYRHLEKTIGVPPERILRLPENMDTPEGRAIFERLGAPKEAKDYKIEMAKEFADDKIAQGLRDVAFKNGLTHRQLESLVAWRNEGLKAEMSALQEQHTAKMTQENDSLKKEWGAAYDQNKEIANQAAKRLGIDNDMLRGLAEILGPAKAFKGLHELGLKTGEAAFVRGQSGGGGELLTPAYAKQRINDLKGDEGFRKRFASGDTDAVREWNKLNEQAFAQQ